MELDDITRANMIVQASAKRLPVFSVKSVPLEKVRATGALSVLKTKIADHKQSIEADYRRMVARLTELFGEALESGLNDAKNDLYGKKTAFDTLAATITAEIASMIENVGTADGVAEIKEQQGLANARMKDLTNRTSPAAAWKKAYSSFMKTLDSIEKDKRQVKTGAIVPAEEKLKPPLLTICDTLASKNPAMNCGTSVFEAKSGIKPAIVKLQGTALEGLVTQPKIKKMMKDISVHLSTHEQGILPMTCEPLIKKVRKTIKDSLGDNCLTQIGLPSADWARKIYAFEMFGMMNVAFSNGGHFCQCECRMVFQGEEKLLLFNPDAVTGTTWKEKRRSIHVMTIDDVATLLDVKQAFLVSHGPGELVVIPSALLHVCASSSAIGLRWSLAGHGGGDGDIGRVRGAVEHMLESFPDLKNPSTSWGQWLAYIQTL